MKTKSTLRKELSLKAGRIQISDHGCNNYSTQVFSGNNLVQDINVTAEQLGKEGMLHVKQSLYFSELTGHHYLRSATGKYELADLFPV